MEHMALFCAGLAFSTIIIIYLAGVFLVPVIKKTWQKKKMFKTYNQVAHWMTHVDRHLKRRNIKIKATVYVIILSFAVTIGIWAGIVLNNPLAALLMAAISFVIPEQIFMYLNLKNRLKKFDQLVETCPMLGAELGRVNVATAIGNTGRSMPEPLGRVLRQAERDLISTGNPEVAFGNMMEGLDFRYGREFVTRLYDCYNNLSMSSMIVDLGQEMESKRKAINENIGKLFTDRMVSIFIILLFFPAYLIVNSIAPLTWEFLTLTLAGKLLICAYLLSIIIGPVIDYTTIRRMEV